MAYTDAFGILPVPERHSQDLVGQRNFQLTLHLHTPLRGLEHWHGATF